MINLYCVWCDDEIIPEISWQNLFTLSKPKSLCCPCNKKLEIIQGERCKKCSRMSLQSVCSDCQWWEKHPFMHDALHSNYSLYSYSEHMSEMVAKWKYRGDYILASAFKELFATVFIEKFSHLLTDGIVIPIPLSEERLYERGFNQAKVLADFLPLESTEILMRIHSEKQSKKTRHERVSMSNPFTINEQINKPVILVDDIYTTGTTLRHAGALLKKHGCPTVYAYTLIRG